MASSESTWFGFETTTPDPISNILEHDPQWPTSHLPEVDHPMEFAHGPILDTERFPRYCDPFNRDDPWYEHCTWHCRHKFCQRTKFEIMKLAAKYRRPRRYACTCHRKAAPPSNSAAARTTSKPITQYTLDTELSSREVEYLGNLNGDKEIEVHLSDVEAFVNLFSNKDFLCKADLISSPALNTINPNTLSNRVMCAKLAEKQFVTQLWKYFARLFYTYNAGKTTILIRPATLKLEFTACMGIEIVDFYETMTGNKAFWYEAELVFDLLEMNKVAKEVWKFWDEGIDTFIKLIALEDFRTKKKVERGQSGGLEESVSPMAELTSESTGKGKRKNSELEEDELSANKRAKIE
jgi:hypothetical protein